MTKNQKRYNLAVAVMTVTLLVFENVNAILELLSKVVNYNAPYIQKFHAFLFKEWEADIRA